jgi:hypothetical protein
MRPLLAILGLLLCLIASRAEELPVIKDSEAVQYVGENVEVRGFVVSVTTSPLGTAFINFGGEYPNQTFAGFIEAGSKLGTDQRIALVQGKIISITGTIELYEGKPEIKVMSLDQIKVWLRWKAKQICGFRSSIAARHLRCATGRNSWQYNGSCLGRTRRKWKSLRAHSVINIINITGDMVDMGDILFLKQWCSLARTADEGTWAPKLTWGLVPGIASGRPGREQASSFWSTGGEMVRTRRDPERVPSLAMGGSNGPPIARAQRSEQGLLQMTKSDARIDVNLAGEFLLCEIGWFAMHNNSFANCAAGWQRIVAQESKDAGHALDVGSPAPFLPIHDPYLVAIDDCRDIDLSQVEVEPAFADRLTDGL